MLISLLVAYRAYEGKAPKYPHVLGIRSNVKSSIAIITIILFVYMPLFVFRWCSPEISIKNLGDHVVPKNIVVFWSPDTHLEKDSSLGSLAVRVYEDNHPAPSGDFKWVSLMSGRDDWSGFYGEAFRHLTGEVVVAFRGTEGRFNDILTDLSMVFGVKPRQLVEGEQFFEAVSKKYPVSFVVGHSLGGAIAQYVAANNNVQGMTLNAFGAAPFLPAQIVDKWRREESKDQVLNVRLTSDVVSEAHFAYTLSNIILYSVDFSYGGASFHIGCTANGQYGAYYGQNKSFPYSLVHAHFADGLEEILTTNDLIFSKQYECSPPKLRIGMLFPSLKNILGKGNNDQKK